MREALRAQWLLFAHAQRTRWLLFAPVLLGVGIALWFWLPWNGQRQAALLLALGVALAGLALPAGARRLVAGAGLLVALGLAVADIRTSAVAAPRLHHRLTAEEMQGGVAGVAIVSGGERTRLLLDRDATDIDPEVRLRLSLAGLPPAGLLPGARAAVTAALGPVPGPTVPGAVDPARRAWYEGVAASGRALGPPRLLAGPERGGLDRFRARWAADIAGGLGGEAGAIAVALAVGEQGRLSPALAEAFRLSGLAHLLSVSGFHVAVVVSGVFFLLRRLFALWPWLVLRIPAMRLAAIGAGVAGTLYAVISGAEVPAVRSAIAAWVVLVAMMLGRDPVSLRLLAFAAMLILLLRPEAMLGASFQLSFAAVVALVLVAQSPPGRWLADNRHYGLLLRAPRLLALMLLTSLAIELALLPIALAHFGRTGVYGALANLLAIPLTSFVVMPLLGAWLLLAAMGLGGLLGWALTPALQALAAIATQTAALPGSALVVPPLSDAACALLAAGGLLAALLAGRGRWLGAPLLAAGVALALLGPRPDIFVSGDGRQVGVAHGGQLYLLRGHRGGYVVQSWAERVAADGDKRLHDLPGARCGAMGCMVEVEGLRLLALTGDGDHAPRPSPQLCAAADVVISAVALPRDCRPGWLRLDRPALKKQGAVAIRAAGRRMESVADRAGDRPWSASALPGWVPRLLGGPAWTGVVAE